MKNNIKITALSLSLISLLSSCQKLNTVKNISNRTVPIKITEIHMYKFIPNDEVISMPSTETDKNIRNEEYQTLTLSGLVTSTFKTQELRYAVTMDDGTKKIYNHVPDNENYDIFFETVTSIEDRATELVNGSKTDKETQKSILCFLLSKDDNIHDYVLVDKTTTFQPVQLGLKGYYTCGKPVDDLSKLKSNYYTIDSKQTILDINEYICSQIRGDIIKVIPLTRLERQRAMNSYNPYYHVYVTNENAIPSLVMITDTNDIDAKYYQEPYEVYEYQPYDIYKGISIINGTYITSDWVTDLNDIKEYSYYFETIRINQQNIEFENNKTK